MHRPHHLAKQIRKLNASRKDNSSYYNFGYEYLGPFLYGFSSWLKNELTKDEIEKIFFFSRDGYMMQKAFQLLTNEKAFNFKYVYFSRKSLILALLYNLSTYEVSLQYLSKSRFVTFEFWLEYYGFNKEKRIIISEKHNIDLCKEYRYNELFQNEELKNIYYELKIEIDQNSKNESDLLYKYLNQIGLDGHCAIVDIGWHGSMQYMLEQFCTLNNISIDLHGYYIGIQPTNKLTGKVSGYLYDQNNYRLRKSVLCSLGIYERLFQSLEGSVIKYSSANNKIIPVLDEYEYSNELNIVQRIIDFQTGGIDFITTVVNKKLSFTILDIAKPLINFGKYPTLKDLKLFAGFYNIDGNKYYYLCNKRIFRYSLRKLLYDLSNSPWKTGFLKSAFKVPFPYFEIYKILRK